VVLFKLIIVNKIILALLLVLLSVNGLLFWRSDAGEAKATGCTCANHTTRKAIPGAATLVLPGALLNIN